MSVLFYMHYTSTLDYYKVYLIINRALNHLRMLWLLGTYLLLLLLSWPCIQISFSGLTFFSSGKAKVARSSANVLTY